MVFICNTELASAENRKWKSGQQQTEETPDTHFIFSLSQEPRLFVVHSWTLTLTGACDQARKGRFQNWFRVSSATSSWSTILHIFWCVFWGTVSLLDEGETLLVQRWTQEWSDEITLILAEVGASWVLMVYYDTVKSISVMTAASTLCQHPEAAFRPITAPERSVFTQTV